jgi:cyclase
MFRPRVIPVLLLKNNGLVKSEKFKDYRYIGDPINTVNLFNRLNADELFILDITANAENRIIDIHLLRRIADEANMPFGVGGGIRNIDHIKNIIKSGAEKVIISTHAVKQPDFIKKAALEFGSSTIAVCIDIKKDFLGRSRIFIENGKKPVTIDPKQFAKKMEEYGAGEIIINSIDNDGNMNGYNIPLIRAISEIVTIPVVALGGAGKMTDFREAVTEGCVSAVAAGSFFIYKGKRRAVLINYPTQEMLDSLFIQMGGGGG